MANDLSIDAVHAVPTGFIAARLKALVLGVTLYTFAFASVQVSISCRGPGKFGPAMGTPGLGRRATLFSLMPKQIAKGRELSSVASMVPALKPLAVVKCVAIVDDRVERWLNGPKFSRDHGYRRDQSWPAGHKHGFGLVEATVCRRDRAAVCHLVVYITGAAARLGDARGKRLIRWRQAAGVEVGWLVHVGRHRWHAGIISSVILLAYAVVCRRDANRGRRNKRHDLLRRPIGVRQEGIGSTIAASVAVHVRSVVPNWCAIACEGRRRSTWWLTRSRGVPVWRRSPRTRLRRCW